MSLCLNAVTILIFKRSKLKKAEKIFKKIAQTFVFLEFLLYVCSQQ